ncbi:family 78 glycoside hydrolase catalytic domain [Deinococcus sp.]|uniref:alpha-L-rhamnosidase n=1 Tax=Deinococcus sp. TaxID=47478 RepID=UPI0028699B07|nr:family 78 glycoside hydrolase catalytic domain [Deinococcus sp.]
MISADLDFDGAPLFRKEFTLGRDHGDVTAATLTVSALGVVEPWINGQRVSGDLLTPGWSSYEWRLRYATYDVRHLIGPTTVIGLAVGNGWYRGRLGWTGKSALYGPELGTIAQLDVTFADGTTQTIVTDDTWTAGPSAVTANDLYDGQTTDARRQHDAWARPNHAGDGWSGVHHLDFDRDLLTPYTSPPVTRWQSLEPVSITTSPSGKTLVDFGQNIVGWIRVEVTGPAGHEVTLRHAEVLEHGELGVRPLRTAKATDTHILSGHADVFEPTLTFHGFRYAEITGWPGELRAENLRAVAISSNLQATGTFHSSNELLNTFHDNVIRGMRGNFVDIPTDCPQRDERMGWTGDIAAFAPTAAFLYDVEAFLAEWLRNLALEQAHHDGIIAYVIPDVLKYLDTPGGFPATESTAVWSDAGVWVPWALYQAYGNADILAAQFESMTAHVRRVESLLSPNGLWDTGFQFGDWLDPDAPPENPAKAKADTGVVATACAYHSASLVAQAASILHKAAEAAEFTALAARLRAAFNGQYVDQGRIVSDCTTVYALAIVFGLLDGADLTAAGDRLAGLTEEAGYRISTGFAGTPFITDALTMTGHVGHAYRLLLEESCPSWLYPVTMGATTVWERWDSMLPDGTINPGQMTSFNHYALGAVADWMHRVVGGIAPLTPGYGELLIAPQPGGDLTEVDTTLVTRHGRVAVHWSLSGDRFTVQTDIPEGVGGVLRLPGQGDQPLRAGVNTMTVSLSVPV